MPTESALNRSLSRGAVHRLYAAGHLSSEARDAALQWLRPRPDWWGWSSRGLLTLGSALLLSGIVFFFAYNWASLGRFAKLGLAEGGLVLALGAAWFVGLDRLVGKVLLVAANVLVGVLLAVYGQIYQTGADACDLFLGWAALTAGWVLVSNFAGHWVLWLVVANVGVGLWWEQRVGEPVAGLCMLLALLNGSALAGHEVAARRGVAWASGRWVRELLWLGLLGCLTLPPIVLIVEGPRDRDTGPLAFPAAALWLLVLIAGYVIYRHRSPDLGALAAGAMSACVVVLTLIGRLLFDHLKDAGAFLFFGLVILGVVGTAAMWLRSVSRAMKEQTHA